MLDVRLLLPPRAPLALVRAALPDVAAVDAMTRGGKPKPTRLRILRGNPGKQGFNKHEPIPDALDPACPDEMSDPVARAEWARSIVPAIRIGHVTSADRVFAIAHCQLWATWLSQLADAAKHAHVIAAGPNNYPTPNPARVMSNKTLLLLARVDSELGFSPTSRTRVSAHPAQLVSAVNKWAGALK